MRILRLLSTFAIACALWPPHGASQEDGPRYADDETRVLIEAMMEAHGGYERWLSVPTVSFMNVFFNPSAPADQSPWWMVRETIEQGSRRAYQHWPDTGARLAYDGERTWTTDWAAGNPPNFMVHFFFFFTQLPFITQEPYAVLGEVGTESVPGIEGEMQTVELTFTRSPGVGHSAEDKFLLYIDPDTHLLRGYKYWIGWGEMLDRMGIPAGRLLGPVLRIHDTLREYDGFVMPVRFHTTSPDGLKTYGYHTVVEYSFTEPFDEAKLEMPEDAVIDETVDTRAPRTPR